MTKHVVNSAQVAHLWANQSQEWARNGHDSVSFNGRFYRSYSTVVARLMPEVYLRNKPVALLSHNHWRNATGRHIRNAENALGRNIRVPDNDLPNAYTWRWESNWAIFHVERVQSRTWGETDQVPHEINVASKYEAYETRCTRICKPFVDMYGIEDTLEGRERAIYEAATDYREYCMAFNYPEPYPNFEYWIHRLRMAWAKYWDPKAAGAREAQRAWRNQAYVRIMSRFYAWQEGIFEYKERDARADAKRLPRGDMKRRAEHIIYEKFPRYRTQSVTAEQWRAGANGYLDDRYSIVNGVWQCPTLLRHKGDELQTSRGANVPWVDALRAWRVIQKVRCSGQEYVPNGLRHGVGGFLINKIEANGNMTIGCHYLDYDEMLRLAIAQAPESVIACYPLPALQQCTMGCEPMPIYFDGMGIEPGEE